MEERETVCEWKLKIVESMIKLVGIEWVTSRQIRALVEDNRPDVKMSTVQIGHLARILADRRLVERERIDPRIQWYRYRAI